MMVSHEHRFIFLKTRKTGGTSVEMLLSPFMGKIDIMTPFSLMDERTRLKRYDSMPQHFLGTQSIKPVTIEKLNSLIDRDYFPYLVQNTKLYPHFHEHMSAKEIREKVPSIVWDNYLKFSITRHPYEVMVSVAYFRLGNAVLRGEIIPRETLLATIDEAIDEGKINNFPIYSIDGEVVADYMIRYSHFAEDIQTLLQKLGFPDQVELPRAKTQFRQDKRPATEILTPAQKARIYELHAREFEVFGYES